MSTATRDESAARLMERGLLAAAREQFWQDAISADSEHDHDALAVAALGLGGLWVNEHRSTVDRAQVTELQRRALGGVDPESSLALRLRLRLAAEAVYADSADADLTALLAAVDEARRRGDQIARAEGLSLAHHCLLGPHAAITRLELAEELIATSVSTGRVVDTLMGLVWRTVDLFLAGDRRAARSLEELRQRLEADRCECLCFVVDALDVMIAVRSGRLDQAEQLAERCFERGNLVGDADAFGWYGAQLIEIRWLQGRSAELLPMLDELSRSTTVTESNPGFVAAIAALAADAGAHDQARAALAQLRSDPLTALRPSSAWMAILAAVCEAAFALDDPDAATEASELLAPFAEIPVMASLGIVCHGSAHRPLGLAAWTCGDLDAAIDHFEAARTADLRVGNAARHAVDSATLADALDARDAPGDRERSIELRRAAIDDARRYCMDARADGWTAMLTPVAATVECERDGQIWTVRVGDRSVSLPHCVGMVYLAELIDNEGVPIPAIELASHHAVAERGAPDELVIDEHARLAYRRRVEELQAEVDDAEVCCDLERAARARIELDLLLDELARAAGLASRTRSFVDDAERARVAVHKAIKRSLVKIAELDPFVGRTLGGRVVTGLRCIFQPAPTA